MRTILLVFAMMGVAVLLTVSAAPAAELTVADVTNVKGDGPDGKGNTADDTWQFWFQLVRGVDYRRLDIATATMTSDQRKNGIRDPKARRGHQGKVRGPIASYMPNPNDTEGWIYHSDWDGRYEGVWGDKKANQVIAHPYTEKMDAEAVAVTYKVPEDGTYTVCGKVTDMTVVNTPGPQADGITCIVDVVNGGDGNSLGRAMKVLHTSKPIGDTVGPASGEFKISSVELKKGQLVRLIIDPNKWWGGDMTRIDSFKIEPAKIASGPLQHRGPVAALALAGLGAVMLIRRRGGC